MPMPNPFNNPAFEMTSLTGSINELPTLYGRVGQMGLFPFKGAMTRTVTIDHKNGVLNMIPSKNVGEPSHVNKEGGRKMLSFQVPHFPVDDVILPADVAGIRKFGSENQLEGIAELVNDRLQSMKNKHDITHEWLRVGALKGNILDGDGTTVLYNLFTEFGITQTAVDFELGTAATVVKNKCMEVVRAIEDALLGEVMQNVHVLCDESFFDKLTGHDSVKEAYMNWQAAANYTEDNRKGFKFGGLTFEEYRGKATDITDVSRKFLATDDGIAFPMGTLDTMTGVAAPGDFSETVNTIGVPYYAKQEARKFNRGVDLHTQSNVLPICKRPGVLIRVHTSN